MRWCWHKWGKWKRVDELWQARCCEKCGKVKEVTVV